MSDHPYELIVGLETHVQLLTQTKLFCGCSTKFGAAPNTQTCPVCTGLPGSLPVMNREAFRLGMVAALALNCEIPEFTKWDRKQYYYPDLPKGYQISQFDLPMSQNGWLEILDVKGRFATKKVGIIRAHLEEDAGKSLHDEAAGKADTRIDLNRTGTPLLEIVSAPDIRSTEETRAYLTELKLMLTYLNVSDCNMQEGSLRVDANINIHIDTPQGKIATPIVEIKNLNSVRHIERALAYEAKRQYEVWQETGHTIKDAPKQTHGWDDAKGITFIQREKEESSDYRYFPDPDLCPVVTSEFRAERIMTEFKHRASGGVGLGGSAEVGMTYHVETRVNLTLGSEAIVEVIPGPLSVLRKRLQEEYGITPYDADVIVAQGRPFVAYFEQLAQISGNGKQAANWMQQTVLWQLNESGISITDYKRIVPPDGLSVLIQASQNNGIDVSRLKLVIADATMNVEWTAETPNKTLSKEEMESTLAKQGIQNVPMSELEAICKELVAANPKIVADVKGGKTQAVGGLLGQAKKRNPNANPNDVRRICLEIIASL